MKARDWYNQNSDKFLHPSTRHRHIWDFIKPYASEIKDKSILDLGCGAGVTSRTFAQMGAKRVVGVDFSSTLLNYARKYNALPEIEYLEADITEPLTDLQEKFHWVMLLDVLEHIEASKLRQVFANIEQYIFPNTLLYLNLPYDKVILLLREYQPETLQIIDEAIPIQGLLWLLESSFGWVPVDMHLWQTTYWEAVFMKKNQYAHVMLELYLGENKSEAKSNKESDISCGNTGI